MISRAAVLFFLNIQFSAQNYDTQKNKQTGKYGSYTGEKKQSIKTVHTEIEEAQMLIFFNKNI